MLENLNQQVLLLDKQLRKIEDTVLVMETENRIIRERLQLLLLDSETQRQQIEKSEESVAFIERASTGKRAVIKSRIESLIAEALRNVYGDKYSLAFTYSVKNNRTAVDVELVKQTDAGVIKRSIEGFGGGVADTIALPLKLLVLLAMRKADRVLLTDEPGKHINPERVELFADFTRQVADKLGIQVILCSHHTTMHDYSNTVHHVEHDGERSIVKREK